MEQYIDEIGFWISPEGKIISVQYDHFKTIWSQPGLFRLKHEEIKEIYSKYNDEDTTVESVYDTLLEKNWIMLKHKSHSWVAYIHHYDRKNCDLIWEWVYYMFNNRMHILSDTQLKIYEKNIKRTTKLSFEKVLLGEFVLYKSCLSNRIQSFIEMNYDYLTEEYIK